MTVSAGQRNSFICNYYQIINMTHGVKCDEDAEAAPSKIRSMTYTLNEGMLKGITDFDKKFKLITARYKNAVVVPFGEYALIVACDGDCRTAGDNGSGKCGTAKPNDVSEFPNEYCVKNCLGCNSFDPEESFSKISDDLAALNCHLAAKPGYDSQGKKQSGRDAKK